MTNKVEAESVWDYPRPPRMEATGRHLRVVHGGIEIADTRRALRVLETSHPPVYYIPKSDVAMECLRVSGRRQSFCEFKGLATYWTVEAGGLVSVDAAWSYERPAAAYEGLRGYLAFYATRVDECWVDGERVQPQPGDFYGGWITADVTGPFKGAPGTMGW